MAFEICQPYVAEACREYLIQYTKPPHAMSLTKDQQIELLQDFIMKLKEG